MKTTKELNMTSKTLLKSLVLSAAVIFSQAAMADQMNLDESKSSLNFVSIKNGTIAETHSIPKLTGSISDEGQLKISMMLASVETNIEIRNTRMNRHVFESEKNPVATITANVADKIPASGVAMVETEAELTIRGVTKTIPVSVMVANTGKEVLVSSLKPIFINAADYGMEEGVLKLKELAKLTALITVVPVNFSLTFNK